jgi:flagellar assembly factor FliW
MTAAATESRPGALVRTVATDLFGVLDVPEASIVQFADGLPGFPDCREWILVDGVKRGSAWLQSLQIEALALLLVDPFPLFPGYAVELSPTELRRVGATDQSSLMVLAIVTLPASRDEAASANLQGPVVINVEAKAAAQLVLNDGVWTVRHAFSLADLA